MVPHLPSPPTALKRALTSDCRVLERYRATGLRQVLPKHPKRQHSSKPAAASGSRQPGPGCPSCSSRASRGSPGQSGTRREGEADTTSQALQEHGVPRAQWPVIRQQLHQSTTAPSVIPSQQGKYLKNGYLPVFNIGGYNYTQLTRAAHISL